MSRSYFLFFYNKETAKKNLIFKDQDYFEKLIFKNVTL